MLDLPPEGGPSSLEVVDQPIERLLDAVELVLEHPAVQLSRIVGEAVGAQHVPHVLVARANDARGILRKDGLQKGTERAGPLRRAVARSESFHRLQEIRVPLETFSKGH